MGWGTHVYLWQILILISKYHFDIWQNQYNIVKLKKKKTVRVLGNVGSDERHSRLEGDWGEGGADGYLSLLPGGGDLRHCSL